ncbi:hypothetical protein CRE_20551 [Caenorhabditis remanei]|uniref:Mos1 transposase HTH domain-containing protein n=1 Tax=Caenorhabditis remanei TaxID=31234 RepID=E3NCD3_CAERE|nr:hypothetical protein CRE_20551 [Caenorhabditis remanei]
MSLKLLTLHPNFNCLDHLVTSNEKWVLYENHHRRALWVDADKQPEDVIKQEFNLKKILLSVWWSVHGLLYWELLPEGKNITADYYSSQLQKVKSKLKTSPLHGHRVHYLHDIAKPHTAKTIKSLLATLHWTVLTHPPYSPDLAPSDYHLFSDMHRSLSWIKVVTMFDFCNILALNNFDFNNVRKLMGQPNITLWKGNLKNADFKCIISSCPRGLVFEENEVKVWCDRRLLLTHFQIMFACRKGISRRLLCL